MFLHYYLNEFVQLLQQNIKLFSTKQIATNDFCNALVWCCLLLSLINLYFHRYLRFFLKSLRIRAYKWQATNRLIWNISVLITGLTVLTIYYQYFIGRNIINEMAKAFPKYRNPLFFPTDNCFRFRSITFVLMAFQLTGIGLDLLDRDFSEAATKLFYCGLLKSLESYGFENFSVVLNITTFSYWLFNDTLTCISWHIPKNKVYIFRILLALKIIGWSYMFLNHIPFNYILINLYTKKFRAAINLFLWLWYGSCVWNSPILQYCSHQIFHKNSTEVVCDQSLSKCILWKESSDVRHSMILQKAVFEIQYGSSKPQVGAYPESSQKAYQTIKCMIALKRKLKRIRQRKLQEDKLYALD